jgi:hypothetical protein
MVLELFFKELCPNCRRPTMQAVIDRHPSNADLALENFDCIHCGRVKTVVLSLKSPARARTRWGAGGIAANARSTPERRRASTHRAVEKLASRRRGV